MTLSVYDEVAGFDDYAHAPQRIHQEVVLGGSRVDLVHRDRVLAEISEAVRSGSPLGIASANLDHIFHFGARGASRSEFDTGALRWLNLLDGAPLAVRAYRLTGDRWCRQSGSELIGPILNLAEQHGWRVGFLGGMPDMHAALRRRLAQTNPQLVIAGCWAPARPVVIDPVASAKLAAEIRATAVDVLIVGLGKPRQEVWIERHAEQTGASALLAFGASADFVAGSVRRAPRFFRATGTEWLFRLASEPRRLARRYLSDGPRAMRILNRHSYLPGQTSPVNRPALALSGDPRPPAEAIGAASRDALRRSALPAEERHLNHADTSLIRPTHLQLVVQTEDPNQDARPVPALTIRRHEKQPGRERSAPAESLRHA